MLMSCHLSSPALLHRHLAINGNTSYGLVHAHLPILTLLSLAQSGKWSHKKAKRDWGRFDGRRKSPPYRLSYQLWPVAPWETASSTSSSNRSGFLSRLFSRSSSKHGGRLRKPLITAGGGQHRIPGVHMSREREGQCVLAGKTVYTIEEYTRLRSGEEDLLRRECQQYSRHLKYKEGCGLAPWPTVHHLKAAFYNQVALWTAITRAGAMADSIIPRLSPAIHDYRRFIQLFHKEIHEARVRSRKTLDPKAASRSQKTIRSDDGLAKKRLQLVPPTLEISLLWHTHRMFPGTYWSWCTHEVRQLIDGDLTPSVEGLYTGLAETRRRWDGLFPGQWPETSFPTEQWAGMYRPDVAIIGLSEGVRFSSLDIVVRGYAPWRKRRRPPPPMRAGNGGSSSGGGGGGYGYSGDGGGDGGGGGGDGGGG